jgi:diacylglycerol kinase (CTP)
MALGTDRETSDTANVQQLEQRKPKHHHHHRSRPTRSSSATTNNSDSQRSLSPVITFHPTPLSDNTTKGVKNITRKVIKRLEGLGHLEMVDLTVSEEDEEPEEWSGNRAVEGGDDSEAEVLYALGKEAVKSSRSKETRIGTTEHIPSPKPKPDLEIPRKLLHASIGPFCFSSSVGLEFKTDHFSMIEGFYTTYLYISQNDVRTIVLVLWMALAVIVPAEILRFQSPKFERVYERCLGFLMRESEKVGFHFIFS